VENENTSNGRKSPSKLVKKALGSSTKKGEGRGFLPPTKGRGGQGAQGEYALQVDESGKDVMMWKGSPKVIAAKRARWGTGEKQSASGHGSDEWRGLGEVIKCTCQCLKN